MILPTHNRAALLPLAIHSVLAQSFPDLELIVVDDGSTDGTEAAVHAIGDPRLRYERLPRQLGVSAARNRGIELARAPLVAFQDSDDEWRPNKLERQVAALEADAAAVMVMCGNLCLDDYSRSYVGVASSLPVVDVGALVTRRIPGAPCWLVRRSALLDEQGFDLELDCFEDWELALRLVRRGRVLLVNQPLHLYRTTPGSLFSREQGYSRNLRRILQRHQLAFQTDPAAWAYYCNLIGQSECQFGTAREGRQWMLRAITTGHGPVRSLLNLAMSFLGQTLFRRYVRLGRAVRARVESSVRPRLPKTGL